MSVVVCWVVEFFVLIGVCVVFVCGFGEIFLLLELFVMIECCLCVLLFGDVFDWWVVDF